MNVHFDHFQARHSAFEFSVLIWPTGPGAFLWEYLVAGMAERWSTLSLPFPESQVTHRLFYRQSSALEIDVFNLPLASSDDDLESHLRTIFSMFGHVDSVSLTSTSAATVKFDTPKGVQRAVNGRRKHAREVPGAFAGSFGIEYFLAKYREVHPPSEVLERVSSEYIRQFEAKEQEMRRQPGARHVVKVSEAEKQEVIRKHQERVKKMQATDFYLFQQKDRPNLVTELLSNDGPAPRHLKKRPKLKRDKPEKPKPQEGK
jgi:hypothetical protein